MAPKKAEAWQAWFRAQTKVVQRRIAEEAIARLLEIGDVRFRSDEDGLDVDCGLYWEATGDMLHE